MMLVLDTVVGNVHADEPLALEVQAGEKTGRADRVSVSFHDAQRRRLRLTTVSGDDVGIDIPPSSSLRDGDVLSSSVSDDDRLVVVDVQPAEAMRLSMSRDLSPEELFEFGLKLGHVLGNQHWPIAIEDDAVLTPVNIDRRVMETVIRTHGFDGIEWEFVPIEPGRVPTGMPRLHEH